MNYGSDAPRSKRVPVACPIGRSPPGTHGHSRTVRHIGPPAEGQADPLSVDVDDVDAAYALAQATGLLPDYDKCQAYLADMHSAFRSGS